MSYSLPSAVDIFMRRYFPNRWAQARALHIQEQQVYTGPLNDPEAEPDDGALDIEFDAD